MFSSYALTVLVALITSQVVRADVVPSEPGPGSSYTAGKTCRVTWEGDSASTTAWKDMSIQLMSGSNYDMQHITTILTGQDGTVNGEYEYVCPELTVYSDIYFYQFTAPAAADKAWTTRFTITSTSGEATKPENALQPSGDAIGWGIGALADPSQAVAAPSSAGGTAAAESVSSGTNASTGSASTHSTSSSGASTSSARVAGSTSASSSFTASASTAASSANSQSIENGALSTLANSHLVQAAVLFSISAFFL